MSDDDLQRRWSGSMPEAYSRWLAPTIFRPFAVHLAGRVLARRPRRVLELAAGTGVLTRELLATGASLEVVATDLNQAMVDLGRGQVPEAAWRTADAMDLPFDPGTFDAVGCQFGVMFFPDKPAAFAGIRRVLEPGGALCFNTWGPLGGHEFEAAVTAGLAQAFPDDPPRFLHAIPHGYADLDVVLADVRAGGLEPVSAETVRLEGQAASCADLAKGYTHGTPLRAEIEARGDLTAATNAVTRELEHRFGPDPVTGAMTAHVVEAVPAAFERRPVGRVVRPA